MLFVIVLDYTKTSIICSILSLNCHMTTTITFTKFEFCENNTSLHISINQSTSYISDNKRSRPIRAIQGLLTQ